MVNKLPYKFSLRLKILTAFVLLVIVPITAIFLYSYYISEQILAEKTSNATKETLVQIDNTLEAITGNLNLASQLLIENSAEEDFTTPGANYSLTLLHMNHIFQNIQSLVSNINYDITFITANGNIYSTLPVSRFDYEAITNSGWYLQTLKSHGYFLWKVLHNDFIAKGNKEENYVSLVRLITDNHTNEFRGVLVLSMNSQVVMGKIRQNSSFIEEYIYLLDSNNNILMKSEDNDDLNTEIEKDAKEFRSSNGSIFINAGDGVWLVHYLGVRTTGWKIARILRYNEVMAEIILLRIHTVILICVSFFVFIFIAYLITSHSTNPITQLLNAMKKVETGNLSVRTPVVHQDEIGQISIGFNRMIEKVEYLLHETYRKQQLIVREEKQKNEYKLKMLQSQINPHFLFNVLNDIKWMAIINKADNVAEMVLSLGHLLEASIGKKGDNITIAEEIHYLKDYMMIQRARYGNKFHVTFEIDEEVLENIVPKLVLQPIVENAIIHGLSGKEAGGLIKVKAYREKDMIILSVEDNGTGMDHQTLNKITVHDGNTHGSLTHIGIAGTNERIRLCFGSEYGLTVTSSVNAGTKVVIKIPERMKDDDQGFDS